MTAQISDRAWYRGKEYSIAGRNGWGLFDPEEHGLKPVGACTACYRGHVCTYEVREGRLFLDKLAISLNGPAPLLFGRGADKESEHSFFSATYDRLRHPLPCTGGFLLADDFIDELYVHMGFHPAWKYRVVHELKFRDGELVSEADRSREMAEFRQELADYVLQPRFDASRDDVMKWIEDRFNWEYHW